MTRLATRASWTVAALVAATCAALPWAFQRTQRPTAILDASYQVVLGQAASRGFVVGRDLVFPYGPLSWLVFPIQNPATYEGYVVYSVVLSLVVACLFVALARRSGWSVWPTLAAFVVLVLTQSLPERRIYAFAVLLIAYLYDDRAPRAPLLVGSATVLFGVLGLAKFTLFALALLLYLLLAATDLVRGRLGGLCWLLLLVVVWPLAWLATYGSLDGCLDFVSTSAEVARAHAAGHQWPGPPAEVVLVVVLAVPSLALATTAGRSGWGATAARAVSFAGLWVVVFKHAFLRQDVHALFAWSTLTALGLTSLVAGTDARELRERRGRLLLGARLALVVACAAGLAWWSEEPFRNSLRGDFLTTARELPMSARRAVRLVTGEERARVARKWDTAMAEIRATVPPPPLAGSVDFYGNDQALAFAYDVDWRPRPVFQSYAASSPRLLALNADHVAQRGADTLVFKNEPTDGRFPTTNDATSWPVLLSHYRVGEQMGDTVLLERREPPGRVERAPLGTVHVGVGERVEVPPVPAGSVVWARMDIPPSLRGRVVRTLWKAPIVHLRPEIPGRPETIFALVPKIVEAGFILSPFVESAADFATLAAALPDRPIALPVIRAFAINASRPAEFGSITVTFERMTIVPPTDTAAP